MAAARVDISCARGENVSFPFVHVTSGTDSTAVNITGWTITATARDEAGRAVLSKTCSVTSGAAGTYTMAVTHAQTLLSAKPYTFDIWRTDSGSEKLMAYGTFTITPDALYP